MVLVLVGACAMLAVPQSMVGASWLREAPAVSPAGLEDPADGDGMTRHDNAVVLEMADDLEDTDAARAERTAHALRVEVGIYLVDVSHLDFAQGTCSVDAYVWLNWDPTQFQAPGENSQTPGALPRAPSETIGVVGEFESELKPVEIRPGYAEYRLVGSIRQDFHLRRFPLDHHTLSIAFEDEFNDDRLLVYVPDATNSTAGAVALPGWIVDAPSMSSYTRMFRSNFGDRALPPGTVTHYAGVALDVPIRQTRLAYFVKLTCGLFIATMMALVSLRVAHYGVDRLGFPVGAIFAVVASQWVISEALPARAPPTIADWLHVISYGVILAVTIVNVVSLRVLEAGDPVRSKRIDDVSFKIITPSWIGLCVLVCWLQ